MLLTLSASCLRPLIRGLAAKDDPRAKSAILDLKDLPTFARETLGLVGLNLSADLLVGADRRTLDSLRERADKAACTCLLLTELEPQHLASADAAKAALAVQRGERIIDAAQILGCSSASIPVFGVDDEASFERAIERLKPIVARAEKRDLSLLISPTAGLTSRPERVTELLKRVGGFRIGTFPDFQFAASSADPAGYMHRLTPYATIVSASTVSFDEAGFNGTNAGGSGFKGGDKPERKAKTKSSGTKPPTKKTAGSPVPPDGEDGEESGRAGAAPVSKSKGKGTGKDGARDVNKPVAKGKKTAGKLADLAADIGLTQAIAGSLGASLGASVGESAKPASSSLSDQLTEQLAQKLTAKLTKKMAEPEEVHVEGDDNELMMEMSSIMPGIDADMAPIHAAYDLEMLLESIFAVGYDGPLTLDYRGGGDIAAGIIKSRDALLAALARIEGMM